MVTAQQELMDLLEEWQLVDGHLSWVAEAISCSKEKEAPQSQNGIQHVQWLHSAYYYRRRQEDEVDDCLEMECNPHNPKYAQLFAYQLNKCVKSVYKFDWNGAVEQGKKLRQGLKQLSGEHVRLLKVTEYFVDVLECCIGKLTGKENVFSTGTTADTSCDISSDLKKRWKELQKDGVNRAVIMYLKGALQSELYRWKDEDWRETLLKVIELDPDYHMWYHYAFRCMRQIRLSFATKHMTAPSSREEVFCNKAHDLAPHIILTKYDLGLVLKDVLWMTVYPKMFPNVTFDPCTVNVDETLQKCLKFFDETRCLAEQHELQQWIVRTTYHTAVLLLNVNNKGKKVLDKEGWHMLENLLEKFPENAYLHQNVAYIYQYGVIFDGKRYLVRKSKARQHFKRALELKQGNYFSCLKNYIKSLNKFLPPVEEVFKSLTEALQEWDSLDEECLADVRMWRGALVWFYNPEEKSDCKRAACEDWLYALENYPGQRENIINFIWSYTFNKHVSKKTGKICTNELKQSLEKVKLDGSSSVKTLQSVEILVKEIEKNPRQFTRVVNAIDKKVGAMVLKPV